MKNNVKIFSVIVLAFSLIGEMTISNILAEDTTSSKTSITEVPVTIPETDLDKTSSIVSEDPSLEIETVKEQTIPAKECLSKTVKTASWNISALDGYSDVYANLIENVDETTYTLCVTGKGAMLDFETGTSQPWSSYKSNITDVVLEDGVTSIGNRAFMGFSNLRQLTIADTVTKFGVNAFHSCTSLSTLKISQFVTEIEQLGIYLNPNLQITVESNSKNFGVVNNVLYRLSDTNTATLLQTSKNASIEEYTVPNAISWNGNKYNITKIGTYGLAGLTNLRKINISSNIIEIESAAFYSLEKLASVNGMENLKFIGRDAFRDCGLSNFIFPQGIESIGDYAFSGTKLTSVNLPKSLKVIQRYAFSGIPAEYVKINSDTIEIGEASFSNCQNLKLFDMSITSSATIGLNVLVDRSTAHMAIVYVKNEATATKWEGNYTNATTAFAINNNGLLMSADEILERHLLPPIRTGYEFEGWYDNVTLTGDAVDTVSIDIHAKKMYFAKFRMMENVVVVDNSNGSVTVTFENGLVLKVPQGTPLRMTNNLDKTISIDFGRMGIVTVSKDKIKDVINDVNGNIVLPAFSIITKLNGSQTYISTSAILGIDGSITSLGTTVTVPKDKIAKVTSDKNGNIIFPAGSIVLSEEGIENVLIGSGVMDKDGKVTDINTVVHSLLNDAKNNLAEGITQEKIDRAQIAIRALSDGIEKVESQAIVTIAQNIQTAKLLVNKLIDSNTTGKPKVTQKQISDALFAVSLVPEGNLKNALQDIVNKIQEEFHRDKDNESIYDEDTVHSNTTGISTGDSSNIYVLLLLSIISLGIICWIIFMVKKKK